MSDDDGGCSPFFIFASVLVSFRLSLVTQSQHLCWKFRAFAACCMLDALRYDACMLHACVATTCCLCCM